MRNAVKMGFALMAFGMLAAYPAHAQTTIFADNFSGSSLGDPSSQSGTASPTPYTAFGTAGSPTVASGNGHVAIGNGDTGFSPNYNFGSAANPITASFDFTFSAVNSGTRWLSFVIGAPTEITSASGSATSGDPSDYSNVYNKGDNGTLIEFIGDTNLSGIRIGNGAAATTLAAPFAYTAGDVYHAAVTYDPSSFAYSLTLTDTNTGTVLVTPTQISGTVFDGSATADYINLAGHVAPGTFSNLSVTAAPEPSEDVALLLGVLGLGGLALFARKSSRATT